MYGPMLYFHSPNKVTCTVELVLHSSKLGMYIGYLVIIGRHPMVTIIEASCCDGISYYVTSEYHRVGTKNVM